MEHPIHPPISSQDAVEEKQPLPEAAAEETAPIATEENGNNHQRKRWLITLTGLFVLIGIAMVLMWWFIWQYEESTEDAYVAGNIIRINSQISAPVNSIYTDNTFLVDEKQLIVLLDDTTTRLNLEQAKANLGQTLRQVTQLFEDVRQATANVGMQQAQLLLAKQEYERRQGLIHSSGVSVEDLENAGTRYEVAKANLVYAKSQLEAAVAQVHGTTVETHPSVEQAKTAVRTAVINQYRTQIFSPARGYVARRLAQVGQWVNPGDALMAVVPLYDLWVDANFKETQLKNMRIGQPVTVTADTYGDSVEYHGKLIGISPGSGDVFDVLPPQNATGNWIKIVQRVPVRVSLDPKQLEKYPLRIGLSTTVTVDTHDLSGKRLAPLPLDNLLYSTDIFEHQLIMADSLIEEIVRRNIYPVQGRMETH